MEKAVCIRNVVGYCTFAFRDLIVLMLFLLLMSCDSVDSKFIFVNHSPVTKSYYFSDDSIGNSAVSFYSQRFYATPKNGNIPKDYDYLKPNKKRGIGMLGSWEDHLDDQFIDSTAFIYIIDSADIGKSAEILVRDSLVSRYKVTSDYMREHNWEFDIY